MKKLLFLFILLSSVLTAQNLEVSGNTYNYCYDGDSYFLKGFSKSLRLSNVDAPEKKSNIYVTKEQPWADSAKQAVNKLLKGKEIVVTFYEKKDKFKRTIISVKVDSIDVGLYLIQNGLAHYIALGELDKETKKLYKEAESKAKLEKIGLWSDDKVYTPAYWRKKYKGYF